VNGVSLREIGAEAGQRNTGAARYHFGSKADLIDAVLRYRMEPINRRRLAMLEELDAEGRGYELRGLTDAFVYPLSDQLGDVGRPSWYLRFVLQAALVHGSAATLEGDQPWTSGVKTLRRRVLAALADLGMAPSARQDRWTLYGGFITHALADREQTLQFAPEQVRTPRVPFLAHIVDTAVALAAAPVTTAHHQRRPA
jgi:AcrR family transcriptional regulator